MLEALKFTQTNCAAQFTLSTCQGALVLVVVIKYLNKKFWDKQNHQMNEYETMQKPMVEYVKEKNYPKEQLS